jgi:hypothetical protein
MMIGEEIFDWGVCRRSPKQYHLKQLNGKAWNKILFFGSDRITSARRIRTSYWEARALA